MSTSKYCSKCGRTRLHRFFSKMKAASDGLQQYCRDCQKIARAEHTRRTQEANKRAYVIPITRQCIHCKETKPGSAFNRNFDVIGGVDTICKVCQAKKHLNLKKRFVEGYGGKCTCCGEHRIEFLTMEHRDKSGAKHRAERDVAGAWRDAIKENFPTKYTVLCYNCNQAESHGRTCPHKLEKETAIRSRIAEIISIRTEGAV